MAISSLVGSFLPAPKQLELLQNLVDKQQFEELHEVLGQIEFSTSVVSEIEESVSLRVIKSLDASLDSEEAGYAEGIVGLLASLDVTFARVQEWALQNLERGLENASRASLELLDKVYTLRNGQKSPQDPLLDRKLISLLASVDGPIAEQASQVLKWRIDAIKRECLETQDFDRDIWLQISNLLALGADNGKYKMCLLFILRAMLGKDPISPQFMALTKTDVYWSSLKQGLGHDIHEIRKYSLSIIKLTLQAFPEEESFENTLVRWSSKDHTNIMAAWKRFITLYEIVALDTALNQFEAASGEILDLLENDFINGQWGIIIFTTGLKASMESVRRFTVSLMFQIRDKAIFHTCCHELKLQYLPASMYAPYFSVIGNECPFGEALSNFVAELITHTQRSPFSDQVPEMILSILSCLYNQRAAFDPPKIYISVGLYRALKLLKLHSLGEDHINLISQLFEVTSEDEVSECTLQTLYLKMLMHIKVDTSPLAWISAFIKHIRANGGSYKYIAPLFDDYIDVALKCFDKEFARNECSLTEDSDSTFQVLVYAIFGVKPHAPALLFLKELVKSEWKTDEYKEFYIAELTNLISNKADDSDYTDADVLSKLPLFGSSAWNSVKLDNLYLAFQKHFLVDKFRFFVSCYQQTVTYCLNCDLVTFEDLLIIYESLVAYCGTHFIGNFRYRDSIYRDFFELLLSFLKCTTLKSGSNTKESELDIVLGLLNRNVLDDNGNYEANVTIVKVCHFILETYVMSKLQTLEDGIETDVSIVEKIVQILSNIWEFVSRDRLVLNQRDLHLSYIKTLFHPTILFFAVGPSNPQFPLDSTLLKQGLDIAAQSYSRRTFLPVLSRSLNQFMETFGADLKSNQHNYTWLVTLLFKIFVQDQLPVNSFKLKPIIAKLFDEQIDVFGGTLGGLYQKVYHTPEIASRVYIVSALLHASDDFKKDSVVQLFENDSNILKAKKSTDGSEELERLLKWQLLMLAVKSINITDLSSIVQQKILPSIMVEGSPLVRVYSEWITAFVLSQECSAKSASKLEDALFEILEDQSRPLLAVTAARVMFVSLKGVIGTKGCTRFLERFISKQIPNCASNKPLIRHFSNSLMLSLWPSLQEHITEEALKGVLENLFLNAQKLQVHGQFRPGDAIIWNLHTDFNLTGIFGGVLLKITDHDVPYISSYTFQKYLTCVDELPIGTDEKDLWLAKRHQAKKASGTEVQKDSPLQTKSGAWETVMNVEDMKSSEAVKRTPLIVVASLVDKAPNLGGICRLCDVLGVGLLTVHDLRVKNHPQFKSVAVTADRWMPMDAVPVDEITSFMRSKKKEGYTLIGLEQTDKSLQLDNKFPFPAKSLILLGTEAQGIPGHLLGELDLCLEIKQSGVIRSMNIQTATAVIVHSYSAQHT
ncbi:LADA_0C01750g1_1 [Lachancea dasiensis]|uniref:LADA_0C01750g1_1 n=1 Tax=Lachancea dasiensis TaxID=1072105 RepID=A0A1G4IXM1_9SACH|nr:LADA_0C01750g1_1 [Lachancea dasiensis]